MRQDFPDSDRVTVASLGMIDYVLCWRWQQALALARRRGEIGDLLLLVEHPPTYTTGRAGHRRNLLIDDTALEALGARFVVVDRGGDITFHGPGQLVAYVVMHLGTQLRSVRRFVERLQRTVIEGLRRFGVDACTDPRYPGVWIGRDKIAAIGVAVKHRVTYHGFALNVDPDLRYFTYMVPCGIPDRGVTSLARVLGTPPPMHAVSAAVVESFAQVFGRCVDWLDEQGVSDLLAALGTSVSDPADLPERSGVLDSEQ